MPLQLARRASDGCEIGGHGAARIAVDEVSFHLLAAVGVDRAVDVIVNR